ncbi:hypothetical protein U9M48_000917 [Paspalum notatum var. saurae]|uniref:Uncharacterized protein n=1 Tax=Paspalum notatum var. saurae TaxID=547442 RepID=A0AAQ3SHR1_PASNO
MERPARVSVGAPSLAASSRSPTRHGDWISYPLGFHRSFFMSRMAAVTALLHHLPPRSSCRALGRQQPISHPFPFPVAIGEVVAKRTSGDGRSRDSTAGSRAPYTGSRRGDTSVSPGGWRRGRVVKLDVSEFEQPLVGLSTTRVPRTAHTTRPGQRPHASSTSTSSLDAANLNKAANTKTTRRDVVHVIHNFQPCISLTKIIFERQGRLQLHQSIRQGMQTCRDGGAPKLGRPSNFK